MKLTRVQGRRAEAAEAEAGVTYREIVRPDPWASGIVALSGVHVRLVDVREALRLNPGSAALARECEGLVAAGQAICDSNGWRLPVEFGRRNHAGAIGEV